MLLKAIFYWILIARQILNKISKMQRDKGKSLRRHLSFLGTKLRRLSTKQCPESPASSNGARAAKYDGVRAAKYHESTKTLSHSQDSQLSDQHLRELQEVFSLFDVNNDKTMDVQELKVLYES